MRDIGPSADLICDGMFDTDGNKLEPCDDYAPGACPSVIRLETQFRNIVPIRTLLRASGIE